MNRHEFMTQDQKEAWSRIGYQGRTHANCIAVTGVARPGKTAHNRAKGKIKKAPRAHEG